MGYAPEKIFDQRELVEEYLKTTPYAAVLTTEQFMAAFPEKVLELWEAARHAVRGIGGSEVAAILGESKFATNLDLYRRKTGQPEAAVSPTTQFMFDMGHDMEKYVARAFVTRHPEWELVEDTRMCRHPLHPCMTGNIDYFLTNKETGEPAILECKYVTPDSEAMWREGPPEYYVLQVRHYMSIWNVDRAFVTALWGNNPYSSGVDWAVKRDLDIEEEIIEEEEAFWECVETGCPPPLRCHKVEALKAFMAANTPSNADTEIPAELTGELYETAERYLAAMDRYSNANKQAQVAKAALEELKAQLIIALGESQSGVIDCADGSRLIVSAKPKSENTVLLSKLETEYPEVYKAIVTRKVTLEDLKKASAAAYRDCTVSVPTTSRNVTVRRIEVK